MWFYTKGCPNKASKILKEQVGLFEFFGLRTYVFIHQVSTLLPETFREHDIRLYCKIRDQNVCSIVRCGFKEFCIAKGYAIPKVLCEN
jgi:hypothetical protein